MASKPNMLSTTAEKLGRLAEVTTEVTDKVAKMGETVGNMKAVFENRAAVSGGSLFVDAKLPQAKQNVDTLRTLEHATTALQQEAVAAHVAAMGGASGLRR